MSREGHHPAAPAPCLTVVIPCYNEEATVAGILRRVLESPYVAEVVLVDDGSTDGSMEAAGTVADTRVVFVSLGQNRGKGAALHAGFARAASAFVIVQDADLEYDPADYEVLLEPLIDGRADVVYGSRFMGGQPHRVLNYWHSVGNRVLTTMSNMVTNLNLTDMEVGYKVFRREVIQGLSLEEERFGFEPEVTAKVARAGWRVYEVGISYAGRTYAEGKKIGWRDGFRAIGCVVRYSPLGRGSRRPPASRSGPVQDPGR